MDAPNTRTGPMAASALLIGAAVFFSLSASAQQGLPQAQPLDQLPTAERQQPGQQAQQQQQQGQQQQPQTQQQGQPEEVLGQPTVDPRASTEGEHGLYEAPVNDLRDSVVVDMTGASIGYVQDIVVKQDDSEAGVVISTGGQQEYVYVPLTEVRLEGEQLLLTSKIEPAPVSERELRDRNFNEIPNSRRPLSDFIQPR